MATPAVTLSLVVMVMTHSGVEPASIPLMAAPVTISSTEKEMRTLSSAVLVMITLMVVMQQTPLMVEKEMTLSPVGPAPIPSLAL